MAVTVFLPCRKGSQRVPRKNIKPFADYHNGLLEIKLRQLIDSQSIDSIVLTTNDEDILKYAEALDSSKIILHHREEKLSSSETSTDDLILHAYDLIPHGEILWTHVTSPFLTSKSYDAIVQKYFEVIENGHDSLMTTSLIHGFLWDENGPINYDRTKEKWPRTQTIEPVHEINSAIFLSSAKNYKKFNDRIAEKPYLYVLDKVQGFDIDWEDDFSIAEAMIKSGVASV